MGSTLDELTFRRRILGALKRCCCANFQSLGLAEKMLGTLTRCSLTFVQPRAAEEAEQQASGEDSSFFGLFVLLRSCISNYL
jgi:hypothetical protein